MLVQMDIPSLPFQKGDICETGAILTQLESRSPFVMSVDGGSTMYEKFSWDKLMKYLLLQVFFQHLKSLLVNRLLFENHYSLLQNACKNM